MLNFDIVRVGKDSMSLHPKTQEEYALARTERKTGSKAGQGLHFAIAAQRLP